MSSNLSKISSTADSPQRHSAATTQGPRIGEAPAPAPRDADADGSLLAHALQHLQHARVDWCTRFDRSSRHYKERSAAPFAWRGDWYIAKVIQHQPEGFALLIERKSTGECCYRCGVRFVLELTHAPA